MIQKVVNKLQKEPQIMEEVEFIMAIDDETILIIGEYIGNEIQQIIPPSQYKISHIEHYMMINNEIFSYYDGHQFITQYAHDNEIDYWNYQERKRFLKDFCQKNQVKENIFSFTINKNDTNTEKLYNKWKKKNQNDDKMTAAKLIKELEKLDPDTVIVAVDYEYGEYPIKRISEVHTHRSCPDCSNCGCEYCDDRKMFERKYIVLE